MGKSLKGKELGRGISQRKDELYQGRFTNRFGKRETIYAPTLKEVRELLRDAQYEDNKQINPITKDVTLDDWFKIWMSTCKKNCRESTKETYKTHYNRVKSDLGWRKISSLSLVVMQESLNKMCSDNARYNSKKVLSDMLEKAIDADLLIKNTAKKLNTVVTQEEKKERRVLTIAETKIFLKESEQSFYNNMFILALETGMRIGELCGLMWSDIDLNKKVLHVNHNLCYFSRDRKYIFELHKTKTKSGKRDIPLTKEAIRVLKEQKIQKQKIIFSGKFSDEQYQDFVFTTKNNKPTQQFLVQESIRGIIKRIQKEHTDFETLTPHAFRHSFATRAVENGMDIKTLSRILGHKTLQLTQDLYVHVTKDTLFEEMKKMEAKRA